MTHTQNSNVSAEDIPSVALHWEFVRAPGPGGQHVNKTASAVQLTFTVDLFPIFDAHQKLRLITLAGRRYHKDGTIGIVAHRHRSQEANRRDALTRLVELLNRAVIKPKARLTTRPTKASKERRLSSKKTRSSQKRLRQKPTEL